MADLTPVPQNDLPQDQGAAQSSQPSLTPVPDADIPQQASSSGTEVPTHDLPNEENPYNTPSQQVLAGVEGAGQGFAGPIATGVELLAHKAGLDTKLGLDLSPEAQRTRAEIFPATHGAAEAGALVGSMLTGTGEAGLIAKGAEHILPEATNVLGKIGSGALKGFINGATIQGGDELTKAMLGQGDPEHPVAAAITNMGASGLLGATTGGLFSAIGQGAGKGLQAIDNGKYGAKANQLLTGMGIAHQLADAGVPIEEDTVNNALRGMGLLSHGEVDYDTLKSGINAYDKMQHVIKSKAGSIGAKMAMSAVGLSHAGPLGAVAAPLLEEIAEPYIDKLVGKGVGLAGKAVFPAIMRAASEGNTDGLSTIMSYAKAVSKGNNLLDNSVKSIFVPGQQFISHQPDSAAIDKLKKIIEDGGPMQQLQNQQQEDADQSAQGFAEGGNIQNKQISHQPDHIANAFPEQNSLLNTAKGRVYDYLNSMRPQEPVNQLSFDTKHKNHVQEKNYNDALKIAASPLSIVNYIKDGTVTPDQINHLNLMYPEVYRAISKRMTDHITKHQLEGKKPSYRLRQSLSMFLAAPLDSTFTPNNIQAVQATFAPKQTPQQGQQQQPQGKTKKDTTNLGKSNKSYLTPNQAGEAEASKRD